MRIRPRLAITAATLSVGAAGLLAALPAHAACDVTSLTTSCVTADSTTSTVTAAVGSTGFRTITALPASLTLANGAVGGPLAVTVTEALAQGSNVWGVTAALTTPLTSGSTTLDKNTLTVADAASPVSVSTGCLAVASSCTVAGGGTTARPLDVAQTLFSVTGESAATLYTGTYGYAGLLKLTVPNGTPTGVYTGTLTLTLVQ
jgi:hypothetical protein